jgi:general secretion pathway protein H
VFTRKSAGFTLIELMVVTAIIGGMIAIAMPYMSNRNAQTKSFLRKMTVLSRELHTKAKLQGVTYRLVIEMPVVTDVNRPPEQKLWVERGNSKVVLSEKEEENERERSEENDEKLKKDPKGFEVDAAFSKRIPEIPTGMRFEKVEITRLKNPVTSGKAFIHYLSQGLVDEAAIHIKGAAANQAWTIAIHPLTGKAELISKPVALKEIKSQ